MAVKSLLLGLAVTAATAAAAFALLLGAVGALPGFAPWSPAYNLAQKAGVGAALPAPTATPVPTEPPAPTAGPVRQLPPPRPTATPALSRTAPTRAGVIPRVSF